MSSLQSQQRQKRSLNPEDTKHQKLRQTSINDFFSKEPEKPKPVAIIFRLPNELLFNLFSFLPPQSVARLARTCKFLRVFTKECLLLSTESLEKLSKYIGFNIPVDSLSENFTFWRDITPLSLDKYVRDKYYSRKLHDFVNILPMDILEIDIQLHLNEINLRDIRERTPLHYAAKNGNSVEVVKKLLAVGARVEVMDKKGRRPLHYAAKNKEVSEVTEKLLAAGANVEVMDGKGRTPLHYAAKNKKVSKVTEKLLAAGANVEVMDRRERTPLHYAAMNKKVSGVTEKLLAAGANVQVTDHRERTPLHYAAENRGKAIASEVIRKLLHAGANIGVMDSSERSPIDIAVYYGLSYGTFGSFLEEE